MWKLYAALAGALFLIASGLYVQHLRYEVTDAKAAKVAAEAQSQLDTRTGQIADTQHRVEVVIRDRTEKSVDAVKALPGSETRIDPARRAGLCAELERLRGSSVCTSPDDPAKPSGALPGADNPDADAG